MKEIGGYIELDTYHMPMLHEGAIALNCGRNALAYLIEARGIHKIWLPYFLCDSVKNVCRKYQVEIDFYHIAENFTPIITDIPKNEWLYVVNYYGQLSGEQIRQLKQVHNRLILDNAQDYFAEPIPGVDTLYTCRKFFGVPDGAFLYTDAEYGKKLPRDESFERIHYILGRYERSASEFYEESARNNAFFANEPIKRMSRLTYNLLHGIDYCEVKKTRCENFEYLNIHLAEMNQLYVKKSDSAFMYPLLISNAADLKKKLQQKKIYIPTLWPNVIKEISNEWLEWNYAANILPLPCDQRYGCLEMTELVEEIKRCIG